MSSASACSTSLRGSISLAYTHILKKRSNSYIRVKLSRDYARSVDDWANAGSSDQWQAGTYPTSDVLQVKGRFADRSGRDRLELRLGYSYRHPTSQSVNDAYHSAYMSGDYFFGHRILAGTDGPSREFDVVVKFSQNFYTAAGNPNQFLVLVAPSYTLPLTADGYTRAYASFTREAKFAGGSEVSTPSNRFDLGLIHDFSIAVKAYVRFSLNTARNSTAAASAVAGAEVWL